MEPPRALLTEDLIPIDLSRLQLRDSRMSPIRAPDRAAKSKSALREVQSVTHSPPDTVIGHPSDQRLVHAPLKHQVLHQPPDRIVGQRGDDGSAEPEASLQTTGDIIFAP